MGQQDFEQGLAAERQQSGTDLMLAQHGHIYLKGGVRPPE
jgi:hypothetical protein